MEPPPTLLAPPAPPAPPAPAPSQPRYLDPRFNGKRIIQLNLSNGFTSGGPPPLAPKFVASNRILVEAASKKIDPALERGSVKRTLAAEYSTFDVAGSLRSSYPRRSDKVKGLRFFTKRVCEKLKVKLEITYNQIADELVKEYFEELANPPAGPRLHEETKNIRRRIYDSLNVLMALGVIEKSRKSIKWIGMPRSDTGAQEIAAMEEEKVQKWQLIQEKKDELRELVATLVGYKNLVQRNKDAQFYSRPPPQAKLHLPFIMVNCPNRAKVDVHIADDKSKYFFEFDRPFEIHDDLEVLKRLGLTLGCEYGDVPPENVQKILQIIPEGLRKDVGRLFSEAPQRRYLPIVPPTEEKKNIYQIHSHLPTQIG
ncbi:hypothetical protein L596_016837 [Steinernema carpocapsae]|uniref:E2F/DP family winged-helix DNA-binding domain-containing protein n=1 Tax=Steinernema carpocapsae TaxID=34508 RepID=A0A4U5NKC7_STECR|nr:hypothetical protein L596_016837 [Steinernema carpocapsae]